MVDLNYSTSYKIVAMPEFEKGVKKLQKSKSVILDRLDKQIIKIIKDPIIGKPLRNVLRNCRRIHVDSFILVYEVFQDEIRLLDFDHHDKVYKKYR